MNVVGGPEFFEKATHYEEGIWETPEADKLFEILDKLADYTHPSTLRRPTTRTSPATS
ncbi:MAG: hypothetical protein ACLRWF_10690 [Ruthenibacterium sp.]